jgi:hypothetical protein
MRGLPSSREAPVTRALAMPLLVDDDVCARAACRYGGALELAPRAAGGTRATLRMPVTA